METLDSFQDQQDLDYPPSASKERPRGETAFENFKPIFFLCSLSISKDNLSVSQTNHNQGAEDFLSKDMEDLSEGGNAPPC